MKKKINRDWVWSVKMLSRRSATDLDSKWDKLCAIVVCWSLLYSWNLKLYIFHANKFQVGKIGLKLNSNLKRSVNNKRYKFKMRQIMYHCRLLDRCYTLKVLHCISSMHTNFKQGLVWNWNLLGCSKKICQYQATQIQIQNETNYAM